ncbi:dolichol-phosphate mannosyltransferase subunit 3 [Schizothecium vesticola]|uniref:Dolichol-phosphate mannosyltransferase subunit 3 n=1 Tax=Schizothecium vesticola TaxID=314040 RepID=A0AA40EPB7_9PEZI|nr:dolichol-phosphate mannosyltransferase subunit 3 [Schizothecium vesticola]
MSRARQTITGALLLSSLYLSLAFELVPLPAIVQKDVVPLLPFWFLVSFGAWLLFRLGWGMFTFRDTPEAYAELMDEIKLAKADLRVRGVDVD